MLGRHDAERTQRQRVRYASGGGEVLGQRVAEAHMDAALHLLGTEPRVDRPPDVVGRHHARDQALLVKDDDLRGIAEGQMGGRIQHPFRCTRAGREAEDVLPGVLAADELLERLLLEVRRQLLRRGLRRRAAQRRAARGPGLPALVAEILVPDHLHDVGGEAGLLADGLQRRREDPLPHLGITVANLQPGPLDHANGDVAALCGPVAKPGALDATADALVLGTLVDVLHGLERRRHPPDALAHDLAGGERVAGTEHVLHPDVPAVQAHLLRQDVHHAFHGELGLVAAKAAHRAAVGIVGVHGLGLDVDVRHPVGTAGMARGTERALGARRVVAAGIGHDPGPHGQ